MKSGVVYLERQKKEQILLFCTRFYVTLQKNRDYIKWNKANISFLIR